MKYIVGQYKPTKPNANKQQGLSDQLRQHEFTTSEMCRGEWKQTKQGRKSFPYCTKEQFQISMSYQHISIPLKHWQDSDRLHPWQQQRKKQIISRDDHYVTLINYKHTSYLHWVITTRVTTVTKRALPVNHWCRNVNNCFLIGDPWSAKTVLQCYATFLRESRLILFLWPLQKHWWRPLSLSVTDQSSNTREFSCSTKAQFRHIVDQLTAHYMDCSNNGWIHALIAHYMDCSNNGWIHALIAHYMDCSNNGWIHALIAHYMDCSNNGWIHALIAHYMDCSNNGWIHALIAHYMDCSNNGWIHALIACCTGAAYSTLHLHWIWEPL